MHTTSDSRQIQPLKGLYFILSYTMDIKVSCQLSHQLNIEINIIDDRTHFLIV